MTLNTHSNIGINKKLTWNLLSLMVPKSVMSETSNCILRLRPRLLHWGLKIGNWYWYFWNVSQFLRLIVRLLAGGLKAWDWPWDHPVSVSVSRPKSRLSMPPWADPPQWTPPKHTQIHKKIPTQIHTQIHTHIHTQIHIQIHTFIHT